MGDLQAGVASRAPLADLDESLRSLLERELKGVGMTGVQVTFEAPERDRVTTWPSPAVNLFLYDIREAEQGRDRSWMRAASPDGGGALERAALRLDCSFAITAWTRNALDEHRLLSQVLLILLAYPELPADMLPAGLHLGAPPAALSTRIAHGRPEGRADFWTAIGSPYKAAIEYAVTLLVVPGQRRARGGAVSGVRVDLAASAARPAGAPVPGDLVSQGGSVVDREGRPAAGAWVLVPKEGRSAVVTDRGRFVVRGLPPGAHELRARAVDGTTATVTAEVPGPAVEIVLET